MTFVETRKVNPRPVHLLRKPTFPGGATNRPLVRVRRAATCSRTADPAPDQLPAPRFPRAMPCGIAAMSRLHPHPDKKKSRRASKNPPARPCGRVCVIGACRQYASRAICAARLRALPRRPAWPPLRLPRPSARGARRPWPSSSCSRSCHPWSSDPCPVGPGTASGLTLRLGRGAGSV